MKRTLASKGKLHTLMKPLPAGTDPHENYVKCISWPMRLQNMYSSGGFLPDLRRPEGKLDPPHTHTHFSLGGNV